MLEFSAVVLAWQRQAAANYTFASRAGRRMKLGLAEVAALEQIQTSGPMSPGEIGWRLSMPSGSVTALIDRLEAKRFVVRKPNPKDRRSTLIVLSEHAFAAAGPDLLPMAERIEAIAAALTPAERATVAGFLDNVRAALMGAADRMPLD